MGFPPKFPPKRPNCGAAFTLYENTFNACMKFEKYHAIKITAKRKI